MLYALLLLLLSLQSCPTLCDPTDSSPSGSPVPGRQEHWSGLPFPTPGNLPDLGIKPVSLASPRLAGRFFTTVLRQSVQSLSRVRLFVTPWTAARQASLSFTISWSLLKLMPFESMMSSNHLSICRSLLLPSAFPSIKIFSCKSVLHIRWPKDWSFSFSISLSNEY